MLPPRCPRITRAKGAAASAASAASVAPWLRGSVAPWLRALAVTHSVFYLTTFFPKVISRPRKLKTYSLMLIVC